MRVAPTQQIPACARKTVQDKSRLREEDREDMNKQLLEILVCPICKGKLSYDKTAHELLCRVDRVAFPIRDDIPVMLEDQARQLHEGE